GVGHHGDGPRRARRHRAGGGASRHRGGDGAVHRRCRQRPRQRDEAGLTAGVGAPGRDLTTAGSRWATAPRWSGRAARRRRGDQRRATSHRPNDCREPGRPVARAVVVPAVVVPLVVVPLVVVPVPAVVLRLIGPVVVASAGTGSGSATGAARSASRASRTPTT